MILVRKLKKDDFAPTMISCYFTEFYGIPPWNEYLKCVKCFPDFSSRGMFGRKELIEKCPICNSDLELFWSPQRAWNYFETAFCRKGFLGFIAITKENEIAGWIWGYDVDSSDFINTKLTKCFYIDMICVIDGYRNVMPSVAGQLYRKILLEVERRRYSHILAMTHLGATRIRKMLKLVGFYDIGLRSKDNPEMDFWIRNL